MKTRELLLCDNNTASHWDSEWNCSETLRSKMITNIVCLKTTWKTMKSQLRKKNTITITIIAHIKWAQLGRLKMQVFICNQKKKKRMLQGVFFFFFSLCVIENIEEIKKKNVGAYIGIVVVLLAVWGLICTWEDLFPSSPWACSCLWCLSFQFGTTQWLILLLPLLIITLFSFFFFLFFLLCENEKWEGFDFGFGFGFGERRVWVLDPF